MAVVGMTMGFRGTSNVQVLKTSPRVKEVKTSIAASATFTGVAVASEYITIATDTNIWAAINSAPTAVAGADYLILAGQTVTFEATIGDKVAVIAA